MRLRLRLGIALMLSLALPAIVVTRVEVRNHTEFVHHRSNAWVALSLAGVAALLLLTRLPSRLLAAGAGVLAGGILANLLWAATHGGNVSNSFILRLGDGGVAFNLADIFTLIGIATLMVASMRLAVRHRDVLPQSTIVMRLVRRVRAR